MNDKVLYHHIRLDTGEVFYVGIGDPPRPYSDDSRNNHWHNIVKKHGYQIGIIKEGLNWESACELEKSEIKRIGRNDLGLGPLVNLTDGGEGTQGVIITEERKKNVSIGTKKAMNNPEIIQKMKDKKIGFIPWNNGIKGIFVGEDNPNYGNNWSEEQKKRSSQTLKKVWEDKGGFTEEHLNKLKEKRKGRKPALGMTHSDQQKKMWSEKRKGDKYINNGIQCKRVKSNLVQGFLSDGWVLGKLQNTSDNTRQKMSEKSKNTKWINKEGKSKMINKYDLDNYLIEGWKLGRK
jgi:hypothetical protein